MTTIEHSHFSTPKARPAISTRAAELVVSALKAYRNRRAIYHLGNLTDTELADIGLRRADLHLAARSPFGVDPTERLGVIAEARAEEASIRRAA
ncbi:DUF1127 domain-containing protein [Arvimicrobium flavum]|uniref:DUF1127 domain-containing protein n=1 Tax=Arvimicrobium flavum TaxID=3393320 RepID=UPI00237ADC1F|nr:DUF1127 domain-containing protein [Mesorhizobium shangrilense]